MEILKEAALRAPGLLFPPVAEYLSLYRDLLRVSSRTTAEPGTRNFYFTLPIRGDPPDVFEVFWIDSLSNCQIPLCLLNMSQLQAI